MAPTKLRYIDLIASSEKTPDVAGQKSSLPANATITRGLLSKDDELIPAAWGEEFFPAEDTSAENEMSVVQFAVLCGKKTLLTADTGRDGLKEVIEYAPFAGLILPGLDYFQAPHHGSRRNVNSDLLDKLLGSCLPQIADQPKFESIISSAKADEDHPRKAVVRALYHRGASVITTEGRTVGICRNAPDRGWTLASPVPYPSFQEE